MNSIAQTTTTTTAPGTVLPYSNERAAYAVYDKPADRRIRPWIISSSVVTAVSFVLWNYEYTLTHGYFSVSVRQ